MFQKLISPGIRNSLVIGAENNPGASLKTAIPTKGKPLDDSTLQSLARKYSQLDPTEIPTSARVVKRFRYRGITYSTRSAHEGSCCVLLHDKTPAVIENILHFSDKPDPQDQDHSTSTLLVVKRYLPAKLKMDPYLQYPILGARLWTNKLEESVQIIDVSEFQTQCAQCPVTWEGNENLVVVVPLSRVRALKIITFLN